MPKPTAIFITHEHGDHFDLRSLVSLDRSTPVFLSCLIPQFVKASILSLSFEVRQVRMGDVLDIGGLNVICLFASGFDVFWESRVMQLLVYPSSLPEEGIFLAVDVGISPHYLELVSSGALPNPRAVIVSNNSSISPTGFSYPATNAWGRETSHLGPCGLKLLHLLLSEAIRPLNPREIVLCGNGMVVNKDQFGVFHFSDNVRLAELANNLSLKDHAFGLTPGETLNFAQTSEYPTQSKVSWVHRKMERQCEIENMLHRATSAHGNVDISPVNEANVDRPHREECRSLIEDELAGLSALWCECRVTFNYAA